ncbi:MAG: hypothetical protein ACE5NM_13370, partial [Sedimentisphaerales bacterium]
QPQRPNPLLPLKFLQSLGREKGMTKEERREKLEQFRYEQRQKYLRSVEEWKKPSKREAWKRLLRVNESQWKTIEPKVEKVSSLSYKARARALGRVIINGQFRWHRHSKGAGRTPARTPDEMTEGRKIADALVDLLEDEKSTDEAIRQKINELLKVRDKARRQLPKAKQELAEALTTPRQEAVFLLMGAID